MGIRVAAAGDVHADASRRADLQAAFTNLRGRADIVLLAGDLTTHGRPEEAQVVADASQLAGLPVFSVLGNHDWHSNRAAEVSAVMEEAGVTMLDRSWATCEVDGVRVGIVGTKGFVGGFPGSHLPDFGEPLLREVYAETGLEVAAIEEGLRATADCDFRIVLLHYSPTLMTLEGERPEIAMVLGSDRLAHPIADHCPDLVLHGHAHAGRFHGTIGSVPVFNVALPMKREFWVFDLSADRPRAPEYALVG
ncbi:MAG TPA: metallophosphoesterase [Thermoleophilaceae bacterium]|jgi:Icc-related predicted phosphoesterase|nr:metallophosphoesterase [Thermoleophilaceae bacterium]